MNTFWLNKQNNKNLIVFFAGWSFDYKPFQFLQCLDYDVLMVYDYNDIEIPQVLNELSNYENKILITWSMGVFVAYLLKDLFKDFNKKIAINGTVRPVDNEFGIPVKMFELTLKHAFAGLSGKFYKNVYKTEDEFNLYMQNPVSRSIENRVSELENLYDLIKSTKITNEKFYDIALVSEFDKIIPAKNQIACHKFYNVPIKILEFGHSPFFNYKSWEEIIKVCQ